MKDEWEALRPAEPTMRADELLECRHLVAVAPVGAVNDHIGTVNEAVRAAEVGGGVGAERCKGILSLDPVLIEIVDPGRAKRDRAVSLRADEHEADPGMRTQGRE